MGMAFLPIQKRAVFVKNTFIVEDESEEREDVEIHNKGARTCVARLSESAPWKLEYTPSNALTIQRNAYSEQDMNYSGAYEKTPTGSECDFDLNAALPRSIDSVESVTSARDAESPSKERICIASSIPTASRRA